MPNPDAHAKLLEFALSLPGAYEAHPWGETVAKVGKKVFAFMGRDDGAGVTVKLPNPLTREHALSLPGAEPSGYGLGASGWVSIPLEGRRPGIDLMKEFIEESYRAIAPRKLVAQLESSETGVRR